MNLELLLIPFGLAFFVSYAVTPLVIRLAWKWGLIDDPKKNKHPKVIHKKPIPRGGGLAIFVGVVTVALIMLPLDSHLLGILGGALILVVMGLLDDKYDLSPYLRLIVQMIAASMPILAGIGITFVSNPLGEGIIDLTNPWYLPPVLGILWIMILMNFLNMGAKGVDGQLTGVVGIAALAITFLSFKFSADITEWEVTKLSAITAGAFLGFLPWHAFPQKIMPSFSGSNLGGYLLGVISILTTTKVGALAVILVVPLLDTGYTIVRRVASGKSPVWGDRGHLHHRLMDIGWSRRSVSYFYWGVTGVLGVLALYLNAETKLYTIIGTSMLLAGFILWLTKRTKF